jgi:hypothetical protein
MRIITTIEKETSWAAIKEAAENHALKSGDKIPVTLKNGEDVVFVIGHDESGKAYFIMEDCLNEQHSMINIQHWLNTKIFALFPDELQNLIIPTTRVQVFNGERTETKAKLFLLSRTEVFGKGEYSIYEPEDSWIDIFPTEKSRVKECGNKGTWLWWLGSPYSGAGTIFCSVTGTGGANSNSASYNRGVAPSFCISES